MSQFYTDAPMIIIIAETSNLPIELQDGIAEFVRFNPHKNFQTEDTMRDNDNEYKWNVRFLYDHMMRPGHLSVTSNFPNYKTSPVNEKFEVVIRYHRKIEAFRGLGVIFGAARHLDQSGDVQYRLNFDDEAMFDTLGLMIDCSRNGVLLVDSVYFMLRNMALMGLNTLQLYTEDTYEVEGEPFFGYLRGRYTQKELASIDDYAYDLGIEVIPCIQTLGHLGQMLQWPKYAHLRDTHEVLLAASEDTYEFIEKLIKAASAPFRSKRIHIGMDEAHGVGEGRYRQLYGYKDATQLFVDHLQRVNEICKRMELQPMIWSDTAQNNTLQGYYDQDSNPAFSELVGTMPSDVALVYWDYYHTVSDTYTQKIKQHRELGCESPWLASTCRIWHICGLWTWSRFWTALPFTFESVRAAAVASKRKEDGVRNAFITIWGDEGNECDMFSALPGLLYYAQHGYTSNPEVDVDLLKRNFGKFQYMNSGLFFIEVQAHSYLFPAHLEGICGADFDDWVDNITQETTSTSTKTQYQGNCSKWLLWEDPFLSFMSPQYAPYDLENHYSSISAYLFKVLETKVHENPLNSRLELVARLASVLSLKCHLRERLVDAYRSGQKGVLFEIAQGRLTTLRQELDELWRYHRGMWMKMYKPFGWEVIELRYGGLRTRLQTMYERIIEYVNKSAGNTGDVEIGLNGESNEYAEDTIPELECDLEIVYEHARTNLMLDYQRVSTPSRLG
ncbi:family 20 glycoside hydrolase [Jimgerdemannia flammicorona]|uniref:beta-N-acetylhexosaminidase n=1 Tax=Jimgerdemannia flammicorona TaxID=994334 RepID=A0A433QAP1_9FUNG|nr:family 20 glycoside hydrolase [Jimgerdemannia flammicorona]